MYRPRWNGAITPLSRIGAFYPETYVAESLMSTLTTLGLTTGLKLCLDAGEGDSYDGSSQSWLDLSGNGCDFFRGTTSGAQASDPTFNGVADTLSSAEFFSHDGGDFFRYDTTNEAWMNNLHKAAIKATLLAVVKPSALFKRIFGTRGAATNTGFFYSVTPGTGQQSIFVRNAGVNVLSSTFTASPNPSAADAWGVFAVSIQEGVASSSFFFSNGVASTPATLTYTLPASGDASFTAEIGTEGNAVFPFETGTSIAMFAAWEGTALTAWQLEQIYNKVRRRFAI